MLNKLKNSQPNEPLICALHNRNCEAYCQECQMLVCVSCTMTLQTPHKNHSFLACIHFRRMIHDERNILSKEYSEDKILRLKEARLEVEVKSQEMIAKVMKITDGLIEKIKQRRMFICDQINELCEKEVDVILDEEKKWREKERVQKKLLEISASSDDLFLLENCKFIINGVENLNEESKSLTAQVYSDFDLNFKILRNLSQLIKNSEKSSPELEKVKNIYKTNPSAAFLQIKPNTEFELTLDIEEVFDIIDSAFIIKEPYYIEYCS